MELLTRTYNSVISKGESQYIPIKFKDENQLLKRSLVLAWAIPFSFSERTRARKSENKGSFEFDYLWVGSDSREGLEIGDLVEIILTLKI